ncbi:MAG: hypothetical protein V9G23_06050 [Giesbergeria sp.]
MKIFVCGQERQVVPDGELCKQGINGPHLNTCFATCVSQDRSADVILSIGRKQRQGSETFDDLRLGFWAREPLQQLLKNQTCGDHDVRAEQGVLELLHLRFGGFNITAKSQRPNAGIDKQRHLWRDRSAL